MRHNSEVDSSTKLIKLIEKLSSNVSINSCSGVHGNEPAGVIALMRAMKKMRPRKRMKKN